MMKHLTTILVLVVGIVSSTTLATATSDQECWYSLLGYDPVGKTLWKKHSCGWEGGEGALYRLELGTIGDGFEPVAVEYVRKKNDYQRIKGPTNKALRKSYERVVPLIDIPVGEFDFVLDRKVEYESQVVGGVLRGKNAKSRRFAFALAFSAPRVESAHLLPDTNLGVVQFRYGTWAGCCPGDGRQRFELFEYTPRDAQVTGQVELRAGPDYLAVVRGKERFQLPIPCPTGKKKGRSASNFPFTIACKGKAPDLVVDRKGARITVQQGKREVSRLHVSTKSSVKIVAERIQASHLDGNSYRSERVVCTYGGRCTYLLDHTSIRTLRGPTTPFCTGDRCLLVPKRRRHRLTFRYHKSGQDPVFVRLPKLAKGERIVEVAANEVVVRKRDGSTEPRALEDANPWSK
jgi:hypothetical protein